MREELIKKYREIFGCKNTGICWCEKCANIEKLIDEIIEHIKQEIDKI